MTRTPDKRCGTCRWLRLGKDPVTGRYDRVSLNHSYDCDWPLPLFKRPIVAASMTLEMTQNRRRVWSNSGTDCPVWEPRPKAPEPA